MVQDEFDKVEDPAIKQLHSYGWTYVPGAELAPDHANAERAYYRDVVLSKRLEAAIERLNPWISPENLRKVAREVTHPQAATLMEANQGLYSLLVNYQSVDQDLGKGRKGQTVRLVDFENPENNEFIVTNQFKVEGVHQNIIPDIVCFVNGLPLAVIECKSPYITSPVSEGINQLRRYANLRNPTDDEGAQRLFWYNQLMVSTCRDAAKVGTISSSAQHYAEWKDPYPLTDAELMPKAENDPDGSSQGESPKFYNVVTAQQRLLAGMFMKTNFLDIVQNFILFEVNQGKTIKKVARYQQYRAVNKVIERLKSGVTRKEKSGVVWHTQGSGKSLTMVMLAVKMRRDEELKKYKLVFITDRTQLDEQLSNTFRDAQNETVINADSVAGLRELLQKDSSDLITAMVQKFQEAEEQGGFKDLNPSDKVIVLADEAHRTQFGNLAMTINAALPNAPKIGFTGTPLLKTQKMGQAFGGYIDQYKINEAVQDGATVRLLYEGRKAKVEVAAESLDSLFDAYFSDYTDEEKTEIKRKYGVERAIREAPARVRRVCIDIIEHYKTRIQPDGFKAMIVVGSRHAATVFKDMLDELGAPSSQVVYSTGHNDSAHLLKYADDAQNKDIIKKFTRPFGPDKEKHDNTAFLIVKDMLLTGFDAPICQVMYIDRQLKDHTLMQAIARVNRTYPKKEAGFVVDYYGLTEHLKEALDLFSSEDVEGTILELKDEIPKLKATHTRVKLFFQHIQSDDVDDYILALKDEEVRAQFDVAFKKFAKQMNVVMPDPAAMPFAKDLKLWGKVAHGARTRYRDHQLDISDAGEKVRQLVDEHISSTGVDPQIPPIDLLAANFKKHVDVIKSDESRASEIESAVKAHINVHLDEDPEYYKSLALRLQDIIQKTNGKWDAQLELLEELVSNIETERDQMAEDHGLDSTEYAFYNILVAEVGRLSGSDVLGEETHEHVKTVSHRLVELFREATEVVDFFNKSDAVKSMKKAIKREVIDYEFYSKELVTLLQERFMDLARAHFK